LQRDDRPTDGSHGNLSHGIGIGISAIASRSTSLRALPRRGSSIARSIAVGERRGDVRCAATLRFCQGRHMFLPSPTVTASA